MSTTTIGTAAPGWPSTGAVLQGEQLHVVSRNLDRTRIAVIDITTWDLVAERTIAAGDGAWGLTAAPDGVHLGLYGARGSANLFRLEGAGAVPLAQLAVDYIWDLTTLPGGRVLGVATEPSLVFTYDPATQRAADIGLLTARQRPRTCTATSSRLVVGGTGDGRAFLVDRPLAGGAARSILPSALAGDDTVYCSAVTPAGRIVIGTGGPALDRPAIAVLDPNAPEGAVVVRLPREALVDTVVVEGNSVYATGRPSGALYRLDLGSEELFRVAVPVAMSETRDLAVAGPRLIGSSGDGSVWEYRPATHAVTVRDPETLGLQLRPQRVQAIAATDDRVDVGGSFTITRHDLPSGTATTVFLPGEAKGMVTVGDTTYMAVYPIGEIWSWRVADKAPRRLTQLDSDQLRPIALVWAAQLQALLATTTDDRKRSVLNTIDPVTGRVDTMDNPLGAGGLAGLAVDGSTAYLGGSGARPAVGAVDLVTGAVRWTVPDVVPEGGFILGLDVSGNRLAITTSRGWFTTIDLTTRAVAQPVRVAQQAGQLRRAGTQLLLSTGDALLRLDPATRTGTTFQSGLGGAYWGWPPLSVDPLGRAWLVRGRKLVRTDPLLT